MAMLLATTRLARKPAPLRANTNARRAVNVRAAARSHTVEVRGLMDGKEGREGRDVEKANPFPNT